MYLAPLLLHLLQSRYPCCVCMKHIHKHRVKSRMFLLCVLFTELLIPKCGPKSGKDPSVLYSSTAVNYILHIYLQYSVKGDTKAAPGPTLNRCRTDA